MGTSRWPGAIALAGLLGCGGTTASNAADGGTGGQDASGSGDAPSSSDAPQTPEGAVADAAAADAGCVTGTVSFEILPAASATTAYCLGTGNCSDSWLDIRPADGGAILAYEMPCETTCSAACEAIACTDQCAAPTRLGDAGAQTTWDGTYFLSSTCGSGFPCVTPACAPPGSYIATFCGYAASAEGGSAFECMGASTPTCTDVPFAWPPPAGSTPVVGVIGEGAADGG